MDLKLTRVNRTVQATGPGGGPLPPRVLDWLVGLLTYQSRAYVRDFETGGRYEFNEERLYAFDGTGTLSFPLGLLPRIRNSLIMMGLTFTEHGKSLVELGGDVHVPDVEGLISAFEIYPGQDECLVAMAKSDGGLITAPTGAGKSVVMRMLCRLYPKARIHIVTKSAALANEILGDLVKTFPSVGMYGGGQRRSGRITVFVAGSLHHGEGKADILLLDEVHELVAPTYAARIGAYTNARVFGFTASPVGRHDGRDIEMEAMCGPVLYTLSYQDLQHSGRVVPIDVEWLRVTDGPSTGGMDPVTRDRVGVWRNSTRNAIIAARARLVSPTEQTLIMVKTIDHIVRLKQLLPEYTIVHAADGMDPAQRDEYIAERLIGPNEPHLTAERLAALQSQFAAGTLLKVISNYVWSTGVNFRNLSVLIRGDAAASTIRDVQIPGRACRPAPGVKTSALLIDCWDEFDESLLVRARGRRRNYLSKGWGERFVRADLGT